MTTEEFSNEFDTLVNAYSIGLPFGFNEDPPQFNEYEKSVFLTQAQESLILGYYSTSIGKDSFETSEEVRRYLDELVDTKEIKEYSTVNSLSDSFKHTIFTLPVDTWFIVYEQAEYKVGSNPCLSGLKVDIQPVTHDSYNKTRRNPFRGPTNYRVLRLDSGHNTVELVSKQELNAYILRYIAKPAPIVLTDLSDISIDGVSTALTCALNTALHRKILELGVLLALSSRAQQKPAEEKKTK